MLPEARSFRLPSFAICKQWCPATISRTASVKRLNYAVWIHLYYDLLSLVLFRKLHPRLARHIFIWIRTIYRLRGGISRHLLNMFAMTYSGVGCKTDQSHHNRNYPYRTYFMVRWKSWRVILLQIATSHFRSLQQSAIPCLRDDFSRDALFCIVIRIIFDKRPFLRWPSLPMLILAS